MRPCMKCPTATFNPKVVPIIPSKCPCRIKTNELRKPSQEIIEKEAETIDEKKEDVPKKKEPCKGVDTPLRKKFKFQKGNNCQLPFSRAWDKNESENSFKTEELPKWLRRQQTFPESLECPRDWDEYERKLWMPICKQPIKPPVEVTFVPIDQAVCVFCLGSLYTGGYLHDLHQKIPYIIKQSQENNDEIIPRIGIRSRITVHKKCYNSYIDRSKPEKETEEKDESDSDTGCDGNKKDSDDEDDKKGEGIAGLVTVRKENFLECLRKPKLPELPSALLSDASYRPLYQGTLKRFVVIPLKQKKSV